MAKGQKAYFGLDWIVSLILAIIPITCYVLGIITRLQRGNILGLILNIIPFTFPFIWICDIVTMILKKDITVFA